MTQPTKARAIADAVADQLRIPHGEIGVQERHIPGEPQDEPNYVSLFIPRDRVDDDARIAKAVQTVQDLKWGDVGYPASLRWVYRDQATEADAPIYD